MKIKDLHPGTEVYHVLLTHFGKGIVEEITGLNIFESMFDKGYGNQRVMVKFEGHYKPCRMRPQSLRKTPNKKKIRYMVEFYKGRGELAVNGGDILILPKKEPNAK